MKNLLMFISILFVCAIGGDAQTKHELKAHYINDVAKLDPIEGIYDVAYLVSQSNTDETSKNSDDIYIYSVGNGEFRILGSNKFKITKIGDTNAYNFVTDYDVGRVTDRIYLEDGCRFSRNHEVPQTQIIKDAGRSARGIRVFIKWDCIKTYPTASMYADAREREKETQPNSWSGSGFALLERYIVTNYHVVENANSIVIQGGNRAFSEKQEATVVATDKVNDLAILKVSRNIESGNLPYSVKTFTSEVGEDVWVLGYPLTSTMGDEIKLTTGVISAKSGYEGNTSMYQVSAPIQTGNSGGPLFDKKGNLIGIICAHHRNAENASYAIKASCLRNLVETSLDHDILPHTNRIATLDLANQVKSVKDFVYYITCKR